MNCVFLVGFIYDDFCDGGFEILAACDNAENAEKILERARKEYPNFEERDFEIRIYKINNKYHLQKYRIYESTM